MRVIYLTNIPAPYKVEFFNNLSNFCDLTILYERKKASDRNENWFYNNTDFNKTIFLKGIELGTDSSISFEAINHFKKNTYDIIVFDVYHTGTAMITMQYLYMKKVKFILSSDGGFIKSDNFIKFKIKNHFIRLAEYYLSPGGETDKYLVHYGADKKKIFRYSFTSLAKNQILDQPIAKYEKQKLRKKLNIKEKIILLSVGQMIPRKGYDVLLNSLEGISEKIGVYIVGGQPTPEYLKLIEEKKIKNVHFIGFKNKEDLTEYYQAADIFVFPTREDIWGLVVIEAMGNGLPVITTDQCNAGLELIEDRKNGFILPSDSVIELSNTIRRIINNPDCFFDLSKKALDSIQKYSFENMANEHLEIFNSILGEK